MLDKVPGKKIKKILFDLSMDKQITMFLRILLFDQ
jgi:hypothetical protein